MTVLLNVTLLGSCAPIWSSALFAFAIVSFMEASVPSGDCSQSGIVKTELALAAAARKSSTDFSAARRSTTRVITRTTDKQCKFFTWKGFDRESEDCVEDLFGKGKNRSITFP